MRKITFKNSKTQAGFTLLELALVIIISGFSMLMLTEFMRVYTVNGRYETTLENTRMAQRALREFFVVQKRYPCPADPTLLPNDLEYGKERCRLDGDIINFPDICTTTDIPPFPLECTWASSRDGDQNGNPDVVTIGILPFRTLYNEIVATPFVEAHKKDGYGTYLSYAVTEQMTYKWHGIDRPTNPNSGAINVVDENGISVITPDSSAHYVLFSHGDNGRGGYTMSGTMIDDCQITVIDAFGNPVQADAAAGLNGAGIITEIENCDNTDALFVKGIRSLAENSDYYDDLLFFNKPGKVPLWTQSLDPNVPLGESYIHNTNQGHVGIDVPDPEQQLHVNTELGAEVSTIGVKYCGNAGDETICVEPEMIAGTGSICPNANEVAYAIQNNRVVCRDVIWQPLLSSCLTGQYLKGFSNLGNPLCDTP